MIRGFWFPKTTKVGMTPKGAGALWLVGESSVLSDTNDKVYYVEDYVGTIRGVMKSYLENSHFFVSEAKIPSWGVPATENEIPLTVIGYLGTSNKSSYRYIEELSDGSYNYVLLNGEKEKSSIIGTQKRDRLTKEQVEEIDKQHNRRSFTIKTWAIVELDGKSPTFLIESVDDEKLSIPWGSQCFLLKEETLEGIRQ